MKKTEINFSEELNEEQYRVVTEGDGPCLVLAGPGSGKTRTLVYRVAYLLSQGVSPTEILLLTFTNKAAKEMLRRVELLRGRFPAGLNSARPLAGLVGGTFHHCGNFSLRRYAEAVGYTRSFGILDRSDSKAFVSEALAELKITKDKRFPKAEIILGIISFAANSCREITPVILSQYPYLEQFIPEIERTAIVYRRRKKEANVMDYDDLLSNWLYLLSINPSARGFYQEKFRYILVDEYQDTNRLQFEIIKVLSGKHRNIMVVGDDGQSIYSFRAAEIKNVLDFSKVFPKARIFRLETNYRSVPEILRLANESIKNNRMQFPKTLKSSRKNGPKPVLVSAENSFAEAQFVTRRILDLLSQKIPLSEIAVLFRARYQATELEMALTGQGIPYLVRGGLRFYEQAHVKDVLSYLSVLVNGRDEIAWRRILLRVEGIGPGYFKRIYGQIRQADQPLAAFCGSKLLTGIPFRSRSGVVNLRKLFRELAAPEIIDQPAKAIKKILESDYRTYCLAAYPDGPERVLEIEELTKIAAFFDSTEQFLSETIMGENYRDEMFKGEPEAGKKFLTLSTIHQAKGLEWKVVFILSLTDGRFPHAKATQNGEGLEEERRLFYVAVTRAKSILYLLQPISSSGWDGKSVIQQPSPFVRELPESCYQKN
ncbi:MAG: ATP-dependent helicase [Candidatus Omnitrophota bacterium]